MSRLAKKFIIVLSLIVIAINVLCILFNSIFVEKYYLRSKKIELNKAYEKMMANGIENLYDINKQIEQEDGIIIISAKKTEDLTLLNGMLAKEMEERGLKLSKFWLWDKDYEKLIDKGQVNQIYNQVQLEYSVLIKFVDTEQEVIALAKIIPHIEETIVVINQFTTLIFSIAILLMILCIIILVKRMTNPLMELSQLAKEIAELHFKKIDIQTKDEIEDLAKSINSMSESIEKTHRELEEKNTQMEHLLANVSHELKTPIALVKAYAAGIKEGMDDGTFLEVIMQQNEDMQVMVEGLLQLAKIKNQQIVLSSIDLTQLLYDVLDEHDINRINGGLIFEINSEEEVCIQADVKDIYSVVTNLLTNAMKYTYDGKIRILLEKNKEGIYFAMTNAINPDIKLSDTQLWQPFYVGEKSRNKGLSGTGLGLAIVKSLLEKHKLEYGCKLEEKEITFYILFP